MRPKSRRKAWKDYEAGGEGTAAEVRRKLDMHERSSVRIIDRSRYHIAVATT